jgi:hypothetical protein
MVKWMKLELLMWEEIHGLEVQGAGTLPVLEGREGRTDWMQVTRFIR